MLQRLRSTKIFNRKLKFSGVRLALSALVFLLGFIGIGLFLDTSIAYEANPNATTTQTVDCNYYVLVHDKEGTPVEGVIIEARGRYYSRYDYGNEHGEPGIYDTYNTVGFTAPSDENGWAHLTTCNLLVDDKADVHHLETISFSLSEESARQKNLRNVSYDYNQDKFDTHKVGDQSGYLSNMVDASLFPDTSQYDPAVISPSSYIEVTSERAFLKATINGSEVIPGTNLDPNGIIGYNYGVYSTTLVSRFLYVSSIMVAPSINTTVTKVWNNADGSHTWPEGKTIQVNVQYGDNEPETLTLDKDNPTKTTQNYEEITGESFNVSEVSVDGYTTAITGNNNDGYTITNTEDKAVGNLRINKLTSDGNTTDEFNVTVTLSGTSTDGVTASTINGQYGDVEFNNGVATFTIKHNQTKNITGLPAGLNYEVEEQDTVSYEETYENQVGTIAKDQTVTVVINNESTTTSLHLCKRVYPMNVGQDKEFMVTMTMSDRSINGVYGDVTFTNGVARIAMKDCTANHDRDKMKIIKIPVGVTISIKEDEYDGYYSYCRSRSGVAMACNYTAESSGGAMLMDIVNEHAYHLTFKKVDSETGEYLHGWEFTIGSAKINEDNNRLTFYLKYSEEKRGLEYRVKDTKNNDIDNIVTKNSDLLDGISIKETKTPDGYNSLGEEIKLWGRPLVAARGKSEFIASSENLIRNSGNEYTFHDIDFQNGELVIKNTKKEGPKEEPKEEPKQGPKQEIPVEVINPKTEDKKLSTLIIMMGSTVLLFGTIIAKRHRRS